MNVVAVGMNNKQETSKIGSHRGIAKNIAFQSKASFFEDLTDDFFKTMDKSNVTQALDKLDGEAGAGAGVGIVIDTCITAPIVAVKSFLKTMWNH